MSSRAAIVRALARRGFRVAPSLPTRRDGVGELRPVPEIAARLMALDALFTWVVYDEEETPAKRLRAYVKRSQLERHLTRSELALYRRPRSAAKRARAAIGWRLENEWPLAWVLGLAKEPPVDGRMIAPSLARQIVDRLPRLDSGVEELLERARPRKLTEVRLVEERFYCAHNAVRSAQLGGQTVPRGFDPIAQGGVIHERRHALTWCLSPGVAWDATPLDT